jgi:hypothetical protein
MKMTRMFAVPFVIALVACTSTTEQEQQDPGLEGPGTGAEAAADTNPYGEPYPTENIGTVPRGAGKPGNRMANFKFLGYPDGDASELKPISMADFYDPEGRTHKLIHIQVSGTWCQFCKQETEVVTPLAPKLKERGVVWLMSLAEGRAMSTPSTQTDLDKWVATFNSPFTHLWDSGNKNLGIFYESAALPWNCTIDAKTMEILEAGVGAQGKQTPEQILAYVDKMLGLVQ